MRPIRVLIISESPLIHKRIYSLFNPDPRIQVVDEIISGHDNMKYSDADVILFARNIAMIRELENLIELMRHSPLPIIVISEQFVTEEKKKRMLKSGVISFIHKSPRSISLHDEPFKNQVIEMILNIPLKTKEPKKQAADTNSGQIQRQHRNNNIPMLVVIGTSAGGPRALQQVIPKLPEDFNSPVLIVQHMPAKFTKSFAERLDSLSKLRVKEAEHEDVIRKGFIYIAPGDYHMTVVKDGFKLKIELNKGALESGHRPSVDVLFRSAAQLDSVKKVAVILTGMGADGAKGIIHLKEKDKNAIVIGEAEETSLVYGMPKAAFKTGCVDKVLPLEEVAKTLEKLDKLIIHQK